MIQTILYLTTNKQFMEHYLLYVFFGGMQLILIGGSSITVNALVITLSPLMLLPMRLAIHKFIPSLDETFNFTIK